MAAEQYVLVVDDDQAIRQLVESVLEDEGHRVLAVADIDTALRVAAERPVSLILLDLVLAGETGNEFLERYKSEGLPQVPIVLLTGWEAPRELPPGIVGHLAKPFDIDTLVEVVGSHLPAGGR